MTRPSVSKPARAARPAARRRQHLDDYALLRKLRAAPAAMSRDQMETAERSVTDNAHGVYRRLAFALLTISGNELVDKVGADREFALECARVQVGLRHYAGLLKLLSEHMDMVDARLLIALATRDDMDAILAEAQRPESRSSELRFVVDNSRRPS